jgi:hypothetical protein
MAKAIVEVAKPLGIAVDDHLIVGKAGHASLKGAEADLDMSALEQSGRYCGHCGFDANDPIGDIAVLVNELCCSYDHTRGVALASLPKRQNLDSRLSLHTILGGVLRESLH